MNNCKIDENKDDCPCSFTSCGKHGVCCDCLRSHLSKKQLPACAFPPGTAATSERSIEEFVNLFQHKGGDWL